MQKYSEISTFTFRLRHFAHAHPTLRITSWNSLSKCARFSLLVIVSYLHSRLSVVDRLVFALQWIYVCDPLLRRRQTLGNGTLQVENEKDEKKSC